MEEIKIQTTRYLHVNDVSLHQQKHIVMQSHFNTTAGQVMYASELVKRPSEIKKRIVDSNLMNNINLMPQNEVVEDYINTYIKRIEMRFMS